MPDLISKETRRRNRLTLLILTLIALSILCVAFWFILTKR
jgi:predicted nucleic acid-binding Zn ribbon protein